MDQLFLLKLAVGRGVKPQAVMYDCAPLVLKADPRALQTYSPRLLSSYIGKCFVCDRTDWIGHWERIFHQNCYLWTFRAYIKERLADMVERVCTPQKWTVRYPARKVYSEPSLHGWGPAYLPATEDELARVALLRPEWRGFPGVSKSRPVSAEVFADGPITRYCAENRIPLIFLWLPMHPTAEKAFTKHLGLTAEACRQAYSSAANRPGVSFVDLHDIDRDPRHFVDLVHMSAAGAVATTERLAEMLKTPPLSTMLKERRGDAQ